MNLKEYLKKQSMSQNAFAKAIECSPSMITLIVQGKRVPSPKLAFKIEKATKNAITRLELLYPKI